MAISMNKVGLGIDTTFDDTSIAILRGKSDILANVTLSQYMDHEEFGGVVPERASRKHMEVINPLINEALKQAGLTFQDLDYIAVSNYPGLLGSILIGVTVAKSLSYALKIPLLGVNHIEAHPYANFLIYNEITFPIVHLVVAGGHTLLLHAKNHFDYEIIGRSVDDAAGECVDKVAKMFGHPMPGGPVVDQAAMNSTPEKYQFPRPIINQNNYNFSFSGLKTAMLRFRQAHPNLLQEENLILSGFFQSIVDVLLHKTFSAAHDLKSDKISVSGGLAASRKLRLSFEEKAKEKGITLFYPPPHLCTDNAAMVTCLAAYKYEAGYIDNLNLGVFANLR
ncbi:MAG: tRNA (adenosine(37)-N6)-threonylcarbamoyltransferase complex transferase subunit TsaD [SAR324 cluster bacterium]|nr:tRNA (adenosine(37)-N6)-threonylcarbamoyltransferase complex transferase subunit TsaD [SAR324 cluster bacterium]